ncbi:LacI family transcriptional regulator [Catenulispora sp. MAP12-49]|uniref:LacI family DNA-binding transcriptional regulator n=1 Tax=unclassified Catenulispora TaxID=414885 RepID=UPI003511D590
MSITIADVAKHAGVSKTTVSRVLNAKSGIGSQTTERVRAAIEELGFVPSSAAVGLARGRTGTVGVLVPFGSPGAPAPLLTSQWMAGILQAVSDTLAAAGFGMRLFTCDDSEHSLERFAARISAREVDGLLAIEPVGMVDHLVGVDQRGLPVVLVDDRDPRIPLPTVSTTNSRGGSSAARHLMDLGRHRPLVITGRREYGCTRQRLAGFTQVYADAGLPVAPEYVIEGDFTVAGGVRAVRHAMQDGMEFDAVFAHNDLSAIGALRAIRQAPLRGLSDGDLALVGFDDIPLASQAGYPLTTVRQPLPEMGEAAARLLVARLSETPAPEPEPTVIPTDLVVRRTEVAG